MNFLTEPTVHVLAAPQFFAHPEYVLPKGGTPSERLIAHGGKGCYDSYGVDGRSIEDHIRGIIASRHGSVLEHACISLFIAGVSRGCSHEIVRHRAGFSYSQRSTRYTREEDANFVLDPYYAALEYKHLAALGPEPSNPMEGALKADRHDYLTAGLDMDEAAILNQFKHHCKISLTAYTHAVRWLMEEAGKDNSPVMGFNGVERRKWARGKARQLLPHALETRMTMTGNLRAWRFFLEERSGPGAEPEIRRLAGVIMSAIAPFAPLVFEDMVVPDQFIDGHNWYRPEVRKV